MREILFRGKRADNGEWVEGFPFVRRNTNGEVIDCFIIQEAYEQVTNGQRYVRSNLKSECFCVIPKTIRQFTGLTDKSGTKIFEGDILRDDDNEENGVVVFFEGEYCVSFDNEFTYGFADIACSCYVNGNIHDNPEFLKDGANE